MELAEISGGHVGKRISSDLGPLKLLELTGGKKGRSRHIKETLASMSDALGPQHNRLFLVGGSWRAFARVDMLRRNYPLHVMHEYRMSTADIRETIDYLGKHDHDEIREHAGISASRITLLPYAAEVLKRIISIFKPKDIAVSSYGIREGMLYEEMPQEMRERDPLIEACLFAEMKDARIPGYGQHLFDFVQDLFPLGTNEFMRLVRAACYLHDVSWRAHPDYRAEVCFDNATRANLGGLKHSERVWLGLALLHRYKNSRANSPFADLFTLLDEKQLQSAEIIGKAMRLGAMLWISDDHMHAQLKINRKRQTVILELSEDMLPLFGEVAQARFDSLAKSLKLAPKMVIT
jgi:exopolyphosphatase/guanosine-5'-triphosphate,3'-diphosphate pyrophosphatase